MKKMKKAVALILCVSMMLSLCVSGSASFNAPKLTQSEWDEIYSSLSDENTLPMLNVGANAGEVSLCWHADAEKADAKVRISEKYSSKKQGFLPTITESDAG